MWTSEPVNGFVDWMTEEPIPACPECGSEDAEYLPHEPGCPSGFPTRDHEGEAVQEASREFEDEHPMAGPF